MSLAIHAQMPHVPPFRHYMFFIIGTHHKLTSGFRHSNVKIFDDEIIKSSLAKSMKLGIL